MSLLSSQPEDLMGSFQEHSEEMSLYPPAKEMPCETNVAWGYMPEAKSRINKALVLSPQGKT